MSDIVNILQCMWAVDVRINILTYTNNNILN